MMNRGDSFFIDDIGWNILDELQKNARISFKELAQKVHLSHSAVIERVKRMEEEGIISGYRAILNPRKMGYYLPALINVATNIGNPDQIINNAIADIPEVVSCWSITGNNDYLMEVLVPSLEFLEELLTELSKYGRLTTNIVLPHSIQKRNLRKPRNSLKGMPDGAKCNF